MITPVLKRFDCTDHDPIASWVPETDEVSYWLVLHVGDPASPAADKFTAHVVTPAGLSAHKAGGGRVGPKPPIVVNPYAFDRVLREVEARLATATDVSWLRVQDKLRAHFDWEFEGFR